MTANLTVDEAKKVEGEHCQRCGTRNLTWHAPSPLWNAVMRFPDGREASERWSIVCPQCFAKLAEERGIVKNAAWCLNVPHGGVVVPLVTVRDGQIWDSKSCLWIDHLPVTHICDQCGREYDIEANSLLIDRTEINRDLRQYNLKPEEKPIERASDDPLRTMDGQKWAQEFMRIWSGRWAEVDEGLMIGWFCNAIMRGYDEATWKGDAELAALRSRVRELEEAGRAVIDGYRVYSPSTYKAINVLQAILERKI